MTEEYLLLKSPWGAFESQTLDYQKNCSESKNWKNHDDYGVHFVILIRICISVNVGVTVKLTLQKVQ